MDNEKTPMLTNRTYDFLKRVVELGLPALGTFYFALAQIWGLSYGEQVVGTIAALATLGGVLLVFADRSYNKSAFKYDGVAFLSTDSEDNQYLAFDLDSSIPGEISKRKELLIKIDPSQ